jgi:hypothetical protein
LQPQRIYFAYATRPGASARRTARHVAHRVAHHRLLCLCRASGCLSTSRGSSSTTSRTSCVRVPRHVARLAVDYFDYAACPGALARRAALHAARRRLLRLRCAPECLGTSCSSSLTNSPRAGSSSTTSPCAGSSSTTSPTPRVRVPRHIARLVTRLVVDYSVRRDFVLRPHWLYFSHTVRSDYLPCGNSGSTSNTSRAATTLSSGLIASTIHLN